MTTEERLHTLERAVAGLMLGLSGPQLSRARRMRLLASGAQLRFVVHLRADQVIVTFEEAEP